MSSIDCAGVTRLAVLSKLHEPRPSRCAETPNLERKHRESAGGITMWNNALHLLAPPAAGAQSIRGNSNVQDEQGAKKIFITDMKTQRPIQVACNILFNHETKCQFHFC
jgi:hypothetical protein